MIHTNVFYTKKGERLACFLDNNDNDSVISIYRCSLEDQFNKKKILSAHINKDPEYHPVVYKFDAPFTAKMFFEFLEEQYYRKGETTMKARVCFLKRQKSVKNISVYLCHKMDA